MCYTGNFLICLQNLGESSGNGGTSGMLGTKMCIMGSM